MMMIMMMIMIMIIMMIMTNYLRIISDDLS